MKPTEIQALGDSIAHMLLSHAAHGLATSSLDGTGEITLRDGLIVAGAAVGAKAKQAWILAREITPAGWTDAAVDLVIYRLGQQNNKLAVGGVELKWWRQCDPSNAANRRRDLLRDFVRAGALYPTVEDFSFVALLSTAGSWNATAQTTGTDKTAMSRLSASGVQKWNLTNMKNSTGIKGALRSLNGKVPIANIFHTELLSSCSLSLQQTDVAFARVWSVKKPQKTKFLSSAEVDTLLAP